MSKPDGYTVLKVVPSEPVLGMDGTYHRILITFAKSSNVKINKTTVEVSNQDMIGSYIIFKVGQPMDKFVAGLRYLADHLTDIGGDLEP